LVEKPYSDGVVRLARGSDDHGEDQAECVGHHAPLATHDLLPCVCSLAGQGHVGGGLHALGVDHGRGRFGLASLFDAGQAGQLISELGEDSLIPPGRIVGVDGAVRWKVMGQVFPGDSRAVDIQDCVENLSQAGGGRLSGGPCGRAGPFATR
jgi:hypothetical protein